MAEIILAPTAQSKVIPLSLRLNDTDTSLVSQLVTNRQFNTADTDAWFSFTLEGLAATTGTFDLTLINLHDKSVFNHTDKVFNTNPFYYKLDSSTDELTNEIRHAGKWVGQLVVTLANGDSTTRKFIFGIEGHILDGTVVQTILLEDYNALIASIESAKDELTQYNIDYASLIGTVTDQEAARSDAEELRVIADDLRETKEGVRQTTFEANEVIRDGVVDSAIEGEMIAQTVATKLAEKEATFAPRMLSLESELAETNTAFAVAVGAMTVDSEVVLARNSLVKGETFPTLDARLEDIEQQISDNAIIMGVYWNKTSSPVLTRTDASVGKVANAGVAGAAVQNDFDNMPIYREMGTVTDTYGNEFVKIPKFYIKKTDGVGFKTIKISKTKYPDYYLPAVFWDFENQVELPYYLHGKYKANLSADNLRLESKVGTFPLHSKNIVQFRDYAKANNNVGAALKGYQQLDIHAQDVLYCLFTVEFATLNSQSIMQGFSTGRYTATDLVTVASTAANTIIVANATAVLYKVGQTVSLGTSQGGHQVFYGRRITAIAVYDGTNKAITVDGAVFNAAVGNMLYNTGAKSGFSADVNASSGTPIANDGKYPCVYRGIESPWGDMWQFVDGVNISDLQAWVCRNADQYASNVFASPYEKVGYVNGNTNGYLKYKGFDKLYPFAELPKEVGGDSATYYSDYYYQATGQRIALVGGGWSDGSADGLSCGGLNNSSAVTLAAFGGRLLKKTL